MSRHFNLDILNGVPMSTVVEAFDDTKRNGSHKVAPCPWHDDHRPSLVLYETTSENRCHCFACGNGGSVISYVMQRLGVPFREACEYIDAQHCGGRAYMSDYRQWTLKAKARSVVEKKPVTYIPMEYVARTVTDKNSFCECMRHLTKDSMRVRMIAEEYMLGMYESPDMMEDVIFWNIDNQGRVRNGKVQRYCTDIRSPQFFRCDRKVIFWIGKQLMREGVLPVNAELDNGCLFGEHLLSRYLTRTVALVESPKNALVCSLFMPQYLWLATGSKSMLSRKVLEPLRGRKVIVYPDRDAITEWNEKLQTMHDIARFEVSDFCERNAPQEDLKFDLADYIINNKAG